MIKVFRGHAHFDEKFLSWKVTTTKKMPEFWKEVLEKTAARPQECLLVDDLIEHITKARDAGINGICLANPAELRKSFETYGWL